MTSHDQLDLFPRNPSRQLTERNVAEIKKRIQKNEFLNRIAADYDVNPGRISEIKTGKCWADVKAIC